MLELRIRAPEVFDLDGVTGLAVTSARVADVLKMHQQFRDLAELPVFVVGDRTCVAMTAAGFGNVVSAGGDVSALVELIAEEQPDGRLLYPCARDRAGNLEGHLEAHGIDAIPVVVYEMEPVGQLPDEVLQSLRSHTIDTVLIYSERTADAFLNALTKTGDAGLLKNLAVVAISPQAAKPLAGYTSAKIAVHPNEKALMERILSPC